MQFLPKVYKKHIHSCSYLGFLKLKGGTLITAGTMADWSANLPVLNADNENFEFTSVGEENSGASVQDQTEEVEMQFKELLGINSRT